MRLRRLLMAVAVAGDCYWMMKLTMAMVVDDSTLKLMISMSVVACEWAPQGLQALRLASLTVVL